jgi:hypothetical protein
MSCEMPEVPKGNNARSPESSGEPLFFKTRKFQRRPGCYFFVAAALCRSCMRRVR